MMQPQGGTATAAAGTTVSTTVPTAPTAPVASGLTLAKVLNKMNSEQGFVDALLSNLDGYCKAVSAKVAAQPAVVTKENDRAKLYLVSPKYSH